MLKADSPKFCKPPTHFDAQNGLSQLLLASNTLCSAQNGLSKLLFSLQHDLRLSKRTLTTCTSLLHALWWLTLNFYKRPTRFAVLKTDSPYFNKALIRFVILKNPTFWTSTGQASNTFWGTQNGLSNLYKPPTRFAGFKTDSPNFCKHPTRFAAQKADFTNFYNPPTAQSGLCQLVLDSYTLLGD